MQREVKYWAVMPAAGAGRRMGGLLPKQYLRLADRMVIEHTLERLLSHPRIAAVYVALAENDGCWEDTAFVRHRDVVRVEGGTERAYSVRNALQALRLRADGQDWVLVHDAARPCVCHSDLDRLIDAVGGHPAGGLLGVPVRDTMKRTDEASEVRETIPRTDLWHAFTPQMFRLDPLYHALDQALARDLVVTDDASAMELAGHAPLIVKGREDNIKITRPADLNLAAFYLQQQEQERAYRTGI